jgi:hypothetical protein
MRNKVTGNVGRTCKCRTNAGELTSYITASSRVEVLHDGKYYNRAMYKVKDKVKDH